jgi:hypothetical protein
MTIFAKLKAKKMNCGNQFTESFPLRKEITKCPISFPTHAIRSPRMTLPFGALNVASSNFGTLMRLGLHDNLLVDLRELPI